LQKGCGRADRIRAFKRKTSDFTGSCIKPGGGMPPGFIYSGKAIFRKLYAKNN
jgi:hypothetical protein